MAGLKVGSSHTHTHACTHAHARFLFVCLCCNSVTLVLLFPFYRQGNWGSEMLNNLPKDTVIWLYYLLINNPTPPPPISPQAFLTLLPGDLGTKNQSSSLAPSFSFFYIQAIPRKHPHPLPVHSQVLTRAGLFQEWLCLPAPSLWGDELPSPLGC